MAGLDSIKHFDEGGTAGAAAAAVAAPLSSIPAETKNGKLNLSGKIALDPTQTEAILARMQSFIDEREDPLRKIMGGVQRAYASTYGPQAELAVRTQQNLENKEVMGAYETMAGYRAAQAQAANEAERYNRVNQSGTTGGTPSKGGVSFPAEIQRQIDMAGTIPEKKAIEAKWLNTIAGEKIKAPGNVQGQYFIDGKIVDLTPNEYQEISAQRLQEGKSPPAPVAAAAPAAAPAAAEPKAPASTAQMKAELLKSTEVPLEALPAPFVAQESSSGKADTSKPNYAGAQGPMQVTKATFDTYKAKGIIPKDYDLNDPAHGYASGILILNDLHKKHSGDINKIAAEYYGGAGAINADGSINLSRTGEPDPKNGKTGPSIGQYINDIRKRMNLPPADLTSAPADVVKGPTATAPLTPVVTPPVLNAAPVTTAAPVTPPARNKAEAQAQIDISKEAGMAEQKKTGEDIALQRAGVVEAGKSAPERKASLNYVNGLLEDPKTARAFGVIMKPGVVNAVLTIAEQGANVGNLGSVGIAGINDAVRKAMPGATQVEIDAAQKATRELALMQLAAAKIYLKGQGAVSDAERGLIRDLAGSIKNSPAALRDFLKWNQMRAEFDEKVGSAYTTFNKNNPNISFERFLETPEYTKQKNEYTANLNAFSSSGVRESTKKPHPGVSLLDKYPSKVK